MYTRLASLRRFIVVAAGSSLGNIDSLYFDPDDWAVRFVSLAKRTEEKGVRSALFSPLSVTEVRLDEEQLGVSLCREPYEVRTDGFRVGADGFRVGADGFRVGAPVAGATIGRQLTMNLTMYYRLPAFWRGTRGWGDYATPNELADWAERCGAIDGFAHAGSPPDLYQHNMLMGREVFSPDGQLGVISDLLVDLVTWRVRYFVVWLQAPGESGEVLLSPFWVNGPPHKQRVTVPMTTEAVLNGPNFAPEDLEPLDEQILARYFGFLKE